MMHMKMLAAAFLALALVGAGQTGLAAETQNAGANAAAGADGSTSKVPAKTVSTFHCLSIYWSPEKGEAGKKLQVKFRETGGTWHDGLAMRYNPIDDFKHPGQKTPECKGDYRGSIVNLTPGTNYEVALTLENTDIRTSLNAATWSEKFPIASTIKCQNATSTLNVDKSGTPEGYVLYNGAGCTIDTGNKSDQGINVNAEYVILRGFTIKNVKLNGINLEKAHHVVIENCDISKWGSEDPEFKGSGYGSEMNAGVYSKYRDLHAIVVQRCKIHNPTWNTNSWAQKHKTFHPDGPQAIAYWEPDSNNVIRYNEFFSDDKHYFNDVIGGAFNGSYRGWPGRDSDIYCNYIANCWDDGIESEGANQNVRIWNNYIENTMMMIANAATSIGPFYVWQNVTGRSYCPPGYAMDHGNLMKMGYADSDKWMTGQMYVFNNTILQPKNEGANGLGGESRVIKHCMSRNNILNVRPGDTRVIATDKKTTNTGPTYDNDFDNDLISADRYPPESEKHAVKGTPKYVANAGFSFETKTGNFQLTADSPGRGKGEPIPNFCEGAAPDMGAQQSGTPPMVYGVKAEFIPPGSAKK
jgi:hypothetical protein